MTAWQMRSMRTRLLDSEYRWMLDRLVGDPKVA